MVSYLKLVRSKVRASIYGGLRVPSNWRAAHDVLRDLGPSRLRTRRARPQMVVLIPRSKTNVPAREDGVRYVGPVKGSAAPLCNGGASWPPQWPAGAPSAAFYSSAPKHPNVQLSAVNTPVFFAANPGSLNASAAMMQLAAAFGGAPPGYRHWMTGPGPGPTHAIARSVPTSPRGGGGAFPGVMGYAGGPWPIAFGLGPPYGPPCGQQLAFALQMSAGASPGPRHGGYCGTPGQMQHAQGLAPAGPAASLSCSPPVHLTAGGALALPLSTGGTSGGLPYASYALQAKGLAAFSAPTSPSALRVAPVGGSGGGFMLGPGTAGRPFGG